MPVCVWIPGTCIWIHRAKSGLLLKTSIKCPQPETPKPPAFIFTTQRNCCSGLQSVVLKKWSLERNESSVQLFHTFWLLWFSLALNLSLLSPFPIRPTRPPWPYNPPTVSMLLSASLHLTDEKYVIIQHIIKTARANEGEIWKVFIENL